MAADVLVGPDGTWYPCSAVMLTPTYGGVWTVEVEAAPEAVAMRESFLFDRPPVVLVLTSGWCAKGFLSSLSVNVPVPSVHHVDPGWVAAAYVGRVTVALTVHVLYLY